MKNFTLLAASICIGLLNTHTTRADSNVPFQETVLGPIVLVEREFTLDLSDCTWSNRPLDGVTLPAIRPYAHCKVVAGERKPNDIRVQTGDLNRFQGKEFRIGTVAYSAFLHADITGYSLSISPVTFQTVPIGSSALDQVEGAKNIMNHFLNTYLPTRKVKVHFQSVQN